MFVRVAVREREFQKKKAAFPARASLQVCQLGHLDHLTIQQENKKTYNSQE
jgi:hypothetical protein